MCICKLKVCFKHISCVKFYNFLIMSNLDIKEIRGRLGLTQKEFAERLSVHYRTVQKWESGETEIKPAHRSMIESVFFSGKEHTSGVPESMSNIAISNSNSIKPIKEGVPYYDMDFAGGWDSDEVFSSQIPAFYITSPDFIKAEFAFNLVGNSISNRIPSGAVIGLREIFDWQTYFPTNELYGILTKNDLRTVKIVKRSKKDGYLQLIPDAKQIHNQTEYEAEEIPINFITRFFQVVAWAQFEKVAM